MKCGLIADHFSSLGRMRTKSVIAAFYGSSVLEQCSKKLHFSYGKASLNAGQVKFKKGPRATRWTKDANIVHQDPNLISFINGNEDHGGMNQGEDDLND